MKRDKEAVLDRAARALRADAPGNPAISVSADRSAVARGIELGHAAFDGAIQDCEGIRRLFGSYRTGTLSPSRKLLVDAHLRDCGACLRVFREGRAGGALNWSLPEVGSAPGPRPLAWGWATAVSGALLVAGLFVYKAYWQI